MSIATLSTNEYAWHERCWNAIVDAHLYPGFQCAYNGKTAASEVQGWEGIYRHYIENPEVLSEKLLEKVTTIRRSIVKAAVGSKTPPLILWSKVAQAVPNVAIRQIKPIPNQDIIEHSVHNCFFSCKTGLKRSGALITPTELMMPNGTKYPVPQPKSGETCLFIQTAFYGGKHLAIFSAGKKLFILDYFNKTILKTFENALTDVAPGMLDATIYKEWLIHTSRRGFDKWDLATCTPCAMNQTKHEPTKKLIVLDDKLFTAGLTTLTQWKLDGTTIASVMVAGGITDFTGVGNAIVCAHDKTYSIYNASTLSFVYTLQHPASAAIVSIHVGSSTNQVALCTADDKIWVDTYDPPKEDTSKDSKETATTAVAKK